MFSIVMSKPPICIPFLEALLDVKISSINVIDKQKDLKDEYDSHGIRLDVYVEDDKGSKYDIEMQTTTQDALEKRVRYYQSGIDRYALGQGEQYKSLNNSYIIFICLEDYFGRGLARYDRVSYIENLQSPAREKICEYQDGSHIIILNANFSIGNAHQRILDFLQYALDTYHNLPVKAESTYIQKIEAAVKTAKTDEGKGKAYMTLTMKMQAAFDEGMAAGKAEGIYAAVFSAVSRMLPKGNTVEEIIEITGFPADLVSKAADELKQQK